MTITVSGGMQVVGGAVFGPQVVGNCDPYYANVSLLLHCEGAGSVTTGNLIDNGPYNNTLSSISGGFFNYAIGFSKWGTASITGGGSSYGLYNDSALWDFGSGDFTVECWAYTQSSSGGFATGFTRFFVGRAAPSLSVTTASWGLGYTGGTGSWIQGAPYMSMIGASGTGYEIFGNAALTADTWHHVAVSRVGTTVYLLADGTVSGTTTVAEALKNPASAKLGITAYGDNGFPNAFDGWLDDIRITKGVGRYSGPYTVPTAPFPNNGC
jgi:hypothetical protein